MSLPTIYKITPYWMQNMMISLKGWFIKRRRFGVEFNRQLLFYNNNNFQKIDNDQLRSFMKEAEKTKFWARKFIEFGVDVAADDLISEISKLPVLTKKEVVLHADEIMNNPVGEQIMVTNSSGTTGSGLVFQQTRTMENKQWAVWWRYRERLGLSLNEWSGWFGGRSIISVGQEYPPYWRINYPMKQVMFSAHHLNTDTAITYYEEIKKRKLRWLHGYPSQLALLASLIKDLELTPLKMSWITTGAENLLAHQIAIIKEMFGVIPFQHYGLAEGVANISQMPDGTFEVDHDFSFVEFIKAKHDESIFHLVGTNYCNTAFPLIRYDTNDLVRLEVVNGKSRVISIDGRNEDYITLPNGVKLGRLDHIFKNADYVNEAQLHQVDLSNIILRIVKGKNYTVKVHEPQILSECRERFGYEVNLIIEYVESIPKTQSGKLKFVISDIK